MKLYHSFLYEETDNAQIEGDIYPVISRVPGKVIEVTAEDNGKVARGDALISSTRLILWCGATLPWLHLRAQKPLPSRTGGNNGSKGQ